ncbi:hypothetical protein CBS101457_005645 [Exobasidium rhododendri]|nr:hypothetical protein CBS101457_005645 [Exobasidium rhododendri]
MSTSSLALKSINETVRLLLKDLISAGKQKRSKSVPALCEAYLSLKACPIQFTSLRQLLPLAGFGEVLIEKLEVLLLEWCKTNGRTYEAAEKRREPARQQAAEVGKHSKRKSDDDGETDSDLDDVSPTRRTNTKAKPKAVESQEKENKTKTRAKVPLEARPKATKAKVATVKEPKLFVPQHRSGTHGILVALYTLTKDQPEVECEEAANTSIEDHYYSKATVIHFAQPYSDSKYIPKTNPTSSHGFGGNFHSAWSGMKTLINRGYVYRRGNPACFGLSHEGWHVSQTCAAREKDLEAGCNVDKIGSIPSTSKVTDEPTTKKKVKASETTCAPIVPTASTAGPFLYTYLTESEPPRHTRMRNQARVRLSDDDFRMIYSIVFPKGLKDHPYVKSCVGGVVEGEESLLYGWVKESVCNELAPGIGREESGGEVLKTAAKKTECFKSTIILPLSINSLGEKSTNNERQPTWSQESAKSFQSVTGAYSQNCNIDIIELLTSSDVELDVPAYKAQTKRPSKQAKQNKDSDSDSDLSDSLPPPRPTKAKKRKS